MIRSNHRWGDRHPGNRDGASGGQIILPTQAAGERGKAFAAECAAITRSFEQLIGVARGGRGAGVDDIEQAIVVEGCGDTRQENDLIGVGQVKDEGSV